jgi:hypothetical protein
MLCVGELLPAGGGPCPRAPAFGGPGRPGGTGWGNPSRGAITLGAAEGLPQLGLGVLGFPQSCVVTVGMELVSWNHGLEGRTMEEGLPHVGTWVQ